MWLILVAHSTFWSHNAHLDKLKYSITHLANELMASKISSVTGKCDEAVMLAIYYI